MNKYSNQDREEIIFDAILKAATKEALLEEIEELPTDEEFKAMYPNTDSLDKKVRAVIKREFKALRFKKAMRVFARTAAAVCVAIVISTSVLLAHPLSRNVILGYLIDVRDDRVRFDFGVDTNANEQNNTFSFQYAPEGFMLVNSVDNDAIITYMFESIDGDVIIMQYFWGRSHTISVDIEYTYFHEVQINDKNAYLFEAQYEQAFNVLMWPHGDDVIMITTSLDIEALISLAEIYMAR